MIPCQCLLLLFMLPHRQLLNRCLSRTSDLVVDKGMWGQLHSIGIALFQRISGCLQAIIDWQSNKGLSSASPLHLETCAPSSSCMSCSDTGETRVRMDIFGQPLAPTDELSALVLVKSTFCCTIALRNDVHRATIVVPGDKR